jgi:hypothetical protein
MAGWYENAERYAISSWILGCLEREIDSHVKGERNRIIKLLEPLAKHDESCYEQGKVSCYFEDCHASSYQYAIELIKGEQK